MFYLNFYLKTVKLFFMEFCANSSIHGVRYFTERKRHWSERYHSKNKLNPTKSHFNFSLENYRRFWWIVAFILSVCLCGTSINNIWMKWHDSPVAMTFSDHEIPISVIPFPTVTICPETKASKNQLDLIYAYYALKTSQPNLTATE